MIAPVCGPPKKRKNLGRRIGRAMIRLAAVPTSDVYAFPAEKSEVEVRYRDEMVERDAVFQKPAASIGHGGHC
jgi:hypothetical protein